MSERFFRSNRPGYPHPVSSELEISGIRVAVGDCSVTERRRWRPPYQTGKTVHVHAKHYNEDGRTAPGVCGNGSVPLSHSGNVVTRIGTHTHEASSVTKYWPGNKCHGKRNFTSAVANSRPICPPKRSGLEVIKLFFMLNSVEHEILNAHKYENIKNFSFFSDSD